MVDIKEVYHIESIIKQALLVVKKQKKQEKQEKYMLGFLIRRTHVQEENELKNKIDFWIREFYMLNPRHIGLQNLLTIETETETEPNRIIQDMKAILHESFDNVDRLARVHDVGNFIDEKTLSELKEEKQKIIKKIIEHTKISVNDFITLIENAPEKIPINEKMVAGVNKTCIDVIQAEDSEKLHEVLEDLDSVIFILPAEYMGRDGPLPVNYKYLAYTYKKNYITSWFNTPARIKYCDTDELNTKQQRAIPYILCPLNFNCDPAYIKLWEIVHIIHSKQRIFYVLYSHSEHPKHKCMKGYESHEMLKIAICDGDDCWKWDDITQCIKDSEPDKIKIQTECNMKNYENYIRRMEMLKKLKRKNEEILENPNTVESVRERETQYRKYRKIR
jgi:hypothetical protein